MCHELLSWRLWPTPPAVLLAELAFKIWWWVAENLLSRYDEIPKSRRFRAGEDGGHSSLEMMCGTFSESHPRVFLAPCDGAEFCWDVFWSVSVPRATMRQRECHLDSLTDSTLSTGQQKREDSVTVAQTITEATHYSLSPLEMLHPHPSTKSDCFGC